MQPAEKSMCVCLRQNLDWLHDLRAMSEPVDDAVLNPYRTRSEHPVPALPVAQHEDWWRPVVRGAGASFVNIVTTFPMNKASFRQQAEGHTLAQAARHMRKEGVKMLYRGLLPPLVQKSLSMSIMFGAYDRLYFALATSSPLSATSTSANSPVLSAHLVASFISGTCEAVLSPFERVQTLLQSRSFNHTISNTSDAVRRLSAHGISEFYRGGTAVILRNGPSTALFFGLRDPLRSLLPQPSIGSSSLWGTVADFVSGAVLGAAISTLAYPLNTIRIHMQSTIGGPRVSVVQALREVLRKHGGSSTFLYRGASLNASRALVSWGIINATYELLRNVI